MNAPDETSEHEQAHKAPSAVAYFESVQSGRNHWWHWLQGAFLIFLIYLIGGVGLFSASEFFELFFSAVGVEASVTVEEFAILALLLLSFLFLILGVFVVQKLWHRRKIKAIITSAERFRWGHLTRAMIVTVVVISFSSVVKLIMDPSAVESLQWAPNIGIFLLGFVICIALVPFQAASEELFFRGYVNQAIIRYVPSPWIAYLVSSVGFALVHAYNPEGGDNILPYLAIIFVMGFGMSTLLHMEGGLESAMGYHIANNLFCFCVLGYETPDLPETGVVYLAGKIVLDWSAVAVELLVVSCIVATITLWHRHAAKPRRS